MPPPVPEMIPCTSTVQLQHELSTIAETIALPETEDSWDKIARAIQRFTALCKGGACDIGPDVVVALRSLSRPLSGALRSERTRLSGAATDLVSAAAVGLARAFDPLVPIYVPVLLNLCTRTSKLFVSRARACLSDIIEGTQLPSLLPWLRDALKEKSVTLRLAATEAVVNCMNCFNPPDLEKEARAEDIEIVIRMTARDANPDVRKASRKVFEAYKILLPGRLDAFAAPLSPMMRKYLDLTTRPSSSNSNSRSQSALSIHSAHSARSEVILKPQFSSSTSALPTKATVDVVPHAQVHARSNSSSAAQTRPQAPPISRGGMARAPDIKGAAIASTMMTKASGFDPRRAERVDLTARAAMPPPDFIPVRPSSRAAQRRTAGGSKAEILPPPTTEESAVHVSRPVPASGGARRVRAAPPPVQSSAPSVPAARVMKPSARELGHAPAPSRAMGGARRVPLPVTTNREPELKAKRPDVPAALRVPSKPLPSSSTVLPKSVVAPSKPAHAPKLAQSAIATKPSEPKKKSTASRSIPPSHIAPAGKGPTAAASAPTGRRPYAVPSSKLPSKPPRVMTAVQQAKQIEADSVCFSASRPESATEEKSDEVALSIISNVSEGRPVDPKIVPLPPSPVVTPSLRSVPLPLTPPAHQQPMVPYGVETSPVGTAVWAEEDSFSSTVGDLAPFGIGNEYGPNLDDGMEFALFGAPSHPIVVPYPGEPFLQVRPTTPTWHRTQMLHPISAASPFVLASGSTPPRVRQEHLNITETPISALVSAIQRGFLESPSLPLSGPRYDPYSAQTTCDFEV